MSFIDHYKLLGVDANATTEEIKTAYRKLSKKFHPDMNDGDSFFADRFKDIQAAYDILFDKNRRAAYQRQYRSFYQPAESHNAGNPLKRKYRLKPVLLLIAVVIATAVFFTERNEDKSQPPIEKKTDYAIVENVDSLITLQNSRGISAAGKGNFRIVLHRYTNYDTAHKTFLQLLAYGYRVIFPETRAGKYEIAMPFDRPLADTALVKDSVEGLFGTKCSVSY